MTTPESKVVPWRTSSYSGSNGACVEVARADGAVQVRDTKNRAGGQLTIPGAAWRALLDELA
ncbi:uncharacterized protein DUF397 [Tamaricihabitans halophyticus]|uniref:Uncharacterized protein DUF397 n=1 Tax=Tamaricihabitans halophyticus TaxID=1262583 RepID=A0A4R2QVT8_9PSEU|nr:DUF397 domain-containing protein [Tamaricihabitans halophyticus]TCP54202.1 uncharacterized protein DUF397 [Tamaricihabitans halophyticus]